MEELTLFHGVPAWAQPQSCHVLYFKHQQVLREHIIPPWCSILYTFLLQLISLNSPLFSPHPLISLPFFVCLWPSLCKSEVKSPTPSGFPYSCTDAALRPSPPPPPPVFKNKADLEVSQFWSLTSCPNPAAWGQADRQLCSGSMFDLSVRRCHWNSAALYSYPCVFRWAVSHCDATPALSGMPLRLICPSCANSRD